MAKLQHTETDAVKCAVIVGTDNPDMNVGKRIKERRVELGLAVVDLARFVGVSKSAVYQWESGDTKSLKHVSVVKAAILLKTTERWINTGKGPKNVADAPTYDEQEAALLAAFRNLSDEEKTAMLVLIQNLAAKGEIGKKYKEE